MFGIDIGWIIGAVVVFVLGIFGIKASGKKEGVQQERSRQVETARKETVVAVETRNKVQAAPQAEVDAKFDTYVRPKK